MLVIRDKIRESKFFPHSIHCFKKQLCNFSFPPALFVGSSLFTSLRVIFVHFFVLVTVEGMKCVTSWY